jgi:hypothetical protein
MDKGSKVSGSSEHTDGIQPPKNLFDRFTVLKAMISGKKKVSVLEGESG